MASDAAYADLEKEALERLAECRNQKAIYAPAMQEAYFFSAPDRCRELLSSTPPPKNPPQDKSLLQISIGIEESENFATTIIQSFMPQGPEWVDLTPEGDIPDVMMDEAKEQAKAVQTQVFKAIADSNLYAELPKCLNPDGAVGTMAMIIRRPRLDKKIQCLAVPIRELEINIGPDGSIDERWAIRHAKARTIRSLVGQKTKLSAKIEKKIKDTPNTPACISWGFWRLWDEEIETWQSIVMVDGEIVGKPQKFSGPGSCELIVMPFNRYPEYPWGNGPLLKSAPELRVLDEMAGGELENIGLSLKPPMTYPDDSFVNIEAGVEPGGWYPIRNGTQDAVKKMYEPNKLDAVYFDQQSREQRVRRHFYNDFPQQRGDTPPTATQWIDEMALAQRRIGTPGLTFFQDGPAQIFMRFMWLEMKAGRVKMLPKGGTLTPNNPTKRAQDQQDVAMAVRAGQIGMELAPEEFKAMFDGGYFLKQIIEKLGVEKMFKGRDPEQVKAAVGLIKQLQGANPQTTNLQPGQLGGPMPTAPSGPPAGAG